MTKKYTISNGTETVEVDASVVDSILKLFKKDEPIKQIEDFTPKWTCLSLPPDEDARLKMPVWMTKNLEIDDGEGGITRNPDHPEYGCYYTWEAAKRIADKIPGWHLPTVQEWDMLAVIAGGIDVAGKKLKSENCWKQDFAGEDVFGFAALPAGYYYGCVYNVGSCSYFWTATEYDSTNAYLRYFGTGESMVSINAYKNRQYSVRLVKDY